MATPPSLEDRFVAAFAAEHPDATTPVLGVLRARWRDAFDAQPGLAPDPEALARAVAGVVPGDAIAACARVPIVDLALALAAGRGDPGAIARIERDLDGSVRHALARAGFARAQIEDVLAVLLAQMVVATTAGPPRIVRYAGRGRLASWLRVCALRLGRRLHAREREVPVEDTMLAAVSHPQSNPEIEYLKLRYASEFGRAFAASVDAIAPRERTLLRLHLVEGLTIDQLAAIYHAPRSSLARRLARARDALLQRIRDHMASALGLGAAELDSVLRLIESRIEITLADLAGA